MVAFRTLAAQPSIDAILPDVPPVSTSDAPQKFMGSVETHGQPSSRLANFVSSRFMTPATIRLVLLVSCAHALVHVYELSFPSVETLIAKEYFGDNRELGKRVMGYLGSTWRLPFGFGALLAGWLVDRYGAKWLLVGYLVGCALTSVATWASPNLTILFITMFSMGACASIYHPAGLSLISRETRPQDRTRALGYHGIFGSLGIASAPLLAGVVLEVLDWRQYYLVIAVPGAVLALLMALFLVEHHRVAAKANAAAGIPPTDLLEEPGHWKGFFILTISGTLSGLTYAALVNFLPRYLENVDLGITAANPRSMKNYLAGGVLLVGVAGQYLAGKIGRVEKLERQLAGVLFATLPLLVAMGYAQGTQRLWAVAAVSFVLFMQQPLYNSLIAQYVPLRRRSLGYGFSNTVAFGIGGLGATYAGLFSDDRIIYGSLAGFVFLAGLVALWLAKNKVGAGARD